MPFDEVSWQSVELRFLLPCGTVVLAEELPNVEKCNDQEIECIKAYLLHGEPTIAVRCIAALDLNTHLGQLFPMGLMPLVCQEVRG